MAKVLYIAANPKDEESSISLRVARKFVEKYKEINPGDIIDEISVYNDEFPIVDKDAVNGWEKLWSHQPFESLSETEKQKAQAIDEFAEKFSLYDKYIVANPMWNFNLPPMLKSFIDSVVIVGKTFKFTPNGPAGLLKNKKLFHVQSSGGIYKGSPHEISDSYLRAIFGFMGVTDVRSVFVEGVYVFPEKAAEIIEQSIKEAQSFALEF